MIGFDAIQYSLGSFSIRYKTEPHPLFVAKSTGLTTARASPSNI
jgi:hypothetical protein